MICVPNTTLWLGNAGDLRDIRTTLNHGVTAIVDLAVEEPIPTIPRTLNYCRFAVTDEGEGADAPIRAAIQVGATFIKGGVQVAVCCNCGINRSPTIAAAILSCGTDRSIADWLETISKLKPIDVNPALLHHVGQISR